MTKRDENTHEKQSTLTMINKRGLKPNSYTQQAVASCRIRGIRIYDIVHYHTPLYMSI